MLERTWPARPLILATLFAVVSYAMYLLSDNGDTSDSLLEHWRIATAAGLGIYAISFGLCSQRQHLLKTSVFALLLGLMVAGICYWRLFTQWPAFWNFFSLTVSLLIITPFFQSSLVSHWNNYSELHKQAWGNAVTLLLAFVFTGISFGMAYLLAELFELVGVELLSELLRKDITRWILSGVAFGGAMGVLREHDSIIDATLRLVQSILSLLAAPLSIGLLVFIGTLPFTGLDSLWQATRNTSPIVFVCAAGAILLLNAVIRETDTGMTAGKIIRLSARALTLCIAPLSAIAVVSIQTRVQQYGWTPDRIWASLICALLMFYGVFYLIAACRGVNWSQHLRQLNLYLAIITAALALFLSTPLLDFGSISTTNQLQRLANGDVSIDNFDTAAMAFDFGPVGRQALEQLDTSHSEELSARVQTALTSTSRWQATRDQHTSQNQRNIKEKLQLRPSTATIDEQLRALLESDNICRGEYCYFLMHDDGQSGSALGENCRSRDKVCEVEITRFMQCDGNWMKVSSAGCQVYQLQAEAAALAKERLKAQNEAATAGDIEVREVTLKQIFIGGQPVGEAFD